jgi:hypothetical protein
MPDALVVNASPLIFLGNDGRLELLRSIGARRVLVPQALFDEVLDRAGRGAADSARRGRVGPGALATRGAHVVLDDLNARRWREGT